MLKNPGAEFSLMSVKCCFQFGKISPIVSKKIEQISKSIKLPVPPAKLLYVQLREKKSQPKKTIFFP
jgi:hypothetical protein